MAEFNFNAMQQAVHDAHAQATDKHAEPSDVQYIPPSPDCMPPAPGLSVLTYGTYQSAVLNAPPVELLKPGMTGQPIAPPEYPSHQAIVQERMSQIELQRVEQARAEIASQLDALQQHAADTAKEQIAADLAASPFSSADIPVLKPDAVVRRVNHTADTATNAIDASQPPAEPGKVKTARGRGAAALEGTPGITIDNCPLLLWLAVYRMNIDANVKGYVFERDEFEYQYLRPVSASGSYVKVKLDVPDRIPLMHNGLPVVVTAEQLSVARADIVARISQGDVTTINPAIAGALVDAFTAPAQDSKRKVPARVSELPVTKVSMLDALRVHIQAHGFKKFGNRGLVEWQWPYQEDASGRRVFAALSYDGKHLTYSYEPDRQPLNEWELLPNGRVNMTEFTRTNRTRVAARDYVRVEQLINNVAGLAFSDEAIRVAFFDSRNGCGEFVTLSDEALSQYASYSLHPAASEMLSQSLNPHDGTWYSVISSFIFTEILKGNAMHDEQSRMIYSEAAARYIIGLFTK